MGQLRYSIIVPVYNKEEYIAPCMDSLLLQMNESDEIILVDDGSADSSGKICDEYAAKHSNVKVIHQANSGVSRARNKGIKASEGQYLLFIDCDDTVDDGLLEEASVLMQNSLMMIFGMSFDYYKDERLIRNEILSYTSDCRYTKKQLEAAFLELFETNSLSSACNKVFLGDIIRRHQIEFNEKMYLYEDLDYVLRYLSYAEDDSVIEIVKHPYYHYRLSAAQANVNSRISDLSRLISNMNELKKGFAMFEKTSVSKDITETKYAEIYLDLLYHHLISSSKLKQSVETILSKAKIDETGIKFEGNRKVLYECIQNKNAAGLEKYIRQRRLKRQIRQTVKKLIGK